jgi:hypothetical protein
MPNEMLVTSTFNYSTIYLQKLGSSKSYPRNVHPCAAKQSHASGISSFSVASLLRRYFQYFLILQLFLAQKSSLRVGNYRGVGYAVDHFVAAIEGHSLSTPC